jgi:membrane-bound inhibitor of C-type lysozyme
MLSHRRVNARHFIQNIIPDNEKLSGQQVDSQSGNRDPSSIIIEFSTQPSH